MFDKLRNARRSAGLTQHEMAERLGYSMAGYRQKEVGLRRITIEEAREIAKVLNTTLDPIFFEDNQSN